MRNEQKTTITTPIPSGTSDSAILSTLHNHEAMINVMPAIEEQHKVSGDASSSATYSITDRKPLPVGRQTWDYTITNQPDGVDTIVNASPPLGKLIITTKWRLVDGALKNDVVVQGNRVMTGGVKDSVNKNHKEWQEKLLQMAAQHSKN